MDVFSLCHKYFDIEIAVTQMKPIASKESNLLMSYPRYY